MNAFINIVSIILMVQLIMATCVLFIFSNIACFGGKNRLQPYWKEKLKIKTINIDEEMSDEMKSEMDNQIDSLMEMKKKFQIK